MGISLYLDCCALQRPFDDRKEIRIATEAEAVLKLVETFEAGGIVIYSSDALAFEISQITDDERRLHCQGILELSPRHIDITDEVQVLANQYERSGIKALDAIHLASAVTEGTAYFCSCDDKFMKKAKDLQTGLTQVFTVLELIQHLDL